MDEQDDVLRDALTRSAPPLPPWLRERAVAAMAATSPSSRDGRSRLIPIAVGVVAMLLTLGLDPFAALRPPPVPQSVTIREASAAVEEPVAQPEPSEEEQSPEEKAVAPYRRRAAEFVRAHYAKDADMLMAAGLLTTDSETSLALLKQALSIKDSTGAWAGYVARLVEEGPKFERPAQEGGDPADPETRAATADFLRQSALPDRLSEKEAAPVLAAIGAWERAEPTNSVPVMHEVRYLYGLHRDAEALARWQHAGNLPIFNTGYWHQAGAVARLLSRMGMRGYDAATASWVAVDSGRAYSWLRDPSRFAAYEGRLAQIQGRPQDAVAWWNATMEVGRHAAASADTVIQVLVGGAVEGIGASYVWKWVSDGVSGAPGGPILGGRIYPGKAYSFYVRQAGREAADEVRDSLLKAKVRSMLLRQRSYIWQTASPLWIWALGNAALAGALAGALCVAFLAAGTWRRREADEATQLGWGLRALMVVGGLLPGIAGAMAVNWLARLREAAETFDPARAFAAALVLTVVLSLALPLIAAWTSRRPGARVGAAWRGNLRQTLPLAVAICGALALCLGLTGKVMQTTWMREWYSGRANEMKRVVQAIGPEWDHPRIPRDAWRAEAPGTRQK